MRDFSETFYGASIQLQDASGQWRTVEEDVPLGQFVVKVMQNYSHLGRVRAVDHRGWVIDILTHANEDAPANNIGGDNIKLFDTPLLRRKRRRNLFRMSQDID